MFMEILRIVYWILYSVYWSRLGRNFYVTNTYLPSSYSKLGMNILLGTRSVATDLVMSQKFNQSAVL